MIAECIGMGLSALAAVCFYAVVWSLAHPYEQRPEYRAAILEADLLEIWGMNDETDAERAKTKQRVKEIMDRYKS